MEWVGGQGDELPSPLLPNSDEGQAPNQWREMPVGLGVTVQGPLQRCGIARL